jgi:predicted nucleotidyltransferase
MRASIVGGAETDPSLGRLAAGALRSTLAAMPEVEILGGPPRYTLEAIRRVVAEACRRTGARRAVLFGSYAAGTADAYSDVDLLIVCPTELGFFERRSLFRDVFDSFPGCDLLVYTPAELEELRGRAGVVGEALRSGTAIYESPAASEAG